MANTILTPQMITREALFLLHSKLTFLSTINKQYDDKFAKKGAKIGNTLDIRLPNQYTIRSGRNLSAQDTEEEAVTLTISSQKGVDIQFYSDELTLSLDDFSKRILEPAMAVLAANIEADALNMVKDVYNLVGTAGSIPTTLKTYLQGRALLNKNLAPLGDRSMHISNDAQVEIVDALKGLFHDQKAVRKQYVEGVMGRTAGFTWYENTMLPDVTNGNKVSGVTVNGAGQTGNTLNIAGVVAGDTFKQGQVFTIAGVYRVHPETKAVTDDLQQFVVTADATMSGTTGSISISPAIVTSGAKQNVSGSPANGAALTFVGAAGGAYTQNICHHRDAFVFATADLVMPKGVDFATREVYDGISMRIVRQYDINTDNFPCRIDVIYGYKTVRPQMACRITE